MPSISDRREFTVKKVVVAITNAYPPLERFQFVAPEQEVRSGDPLPAILLMPAELEETSLTVLQREFLFDQDDIKKLTIALYRKSAADRVWLHGHSDITYQKTLLSKGLLSGSHPLTPQKILHPVWYVVCIDVNTIEQVEVPLGDQSINWWSFQFFQESEKESENLLRRCVGIAEPSPATRSTHFSPDCLPAGGFQEGCLTGATAILRQADPEGFNILLGDTNQDAQQLLTTVKSVLGLDVYVGDGGILQAEKIAEYRGTGVALSDLVKI